MTDREYPGDLEIANLENGLRIAGPMVQAEATDQLIVISPQTQPTLSTAVFGTLQRLGSVSSLLPSDDRSTWTMPRTSSATLCQRCSFAALVRLATHTVRAQLQLASVVRERLRSQS